MLIYSHIVELISTFNYVAEFLYVNNYNAKSIKIMFIVKLFFIYTLLKIKVLHNAIGEHFLSKWFHKGPLTSEEPFCFTNGSLWRKRVLQIIKR